MTVRYKVYKSQSESAEYPWFFNTADADIDSLEYGNVATWQQAMHAANHCAKNDGEWL